VILVYYGPAKRFCRNLPAPHPAPPHEPAYLAASVRAQRQQHRHVARLAPDRIRLERLSPPPFCDSWQGVRHEPDARKVLLSRFGFRVNECFLYEYDFGDLSQHQIRFEGVQPIREKKIYPVCVDGACASPPEDCGGPKAYMEKIDHHCDRYIYYTYKLSLIARPGLSV
jgi:Plasmid pRiA4b ORF-3-like protein